MIIEATTASRIRALQTQEVRAIELACDDWIDTRSTLADVGETRFCPRGHGWQRVMTVQLSDVS